MITHNSYFEGRVQSLGFTRHGRKYTAGIIEPGEYHFGTGGPERMTVVSGEFRAKIGANGAWTTYPAGTSFEIAGQSGFDVQASEPAAYVCEFI